MNKKTRKTLILCVKLLIAAALLAWVFSQVHWRDYVVEADTGDTYSVVDVRGDDATVAVGWARQETETRPLSDFRPVGETERRIRTGFASSIEDIHVPLLIGACAGFLVQLLIVTVRWWLLLRVQDITISLWEATRLTFLGQFFNAVVPGTVGGDLAKAYYAAKHTDRKMAALVSVVVDRVMGLAELTVLAAAMVLITAAAGLIGGEQLRRVTLSVIVIVAITGGGMAFLFSRRFRRMFHLQKLYSRFSFAHHLAAAGDAATIYRHRPWALVRAFGMTFFAHAAFIGSIMLVGMSLSVPVPWYTYFLYCPLIYIIGAIPLTPGGIGLVEKLYLVFFAVNPSIVLALALLARLIPVLWGLPGAIVTVTGARIPAAETMEAELGLTEEGDDDGPDATSQGPAAV